MLIVVLVLVLVALGLLVVSLVLGNGLFAWLSIVASVLAAVALLLDIFRRRGGRGGREAEGGGQTEAPESASGAGVGGTAALTAEQPDETADGAAAVEEDGSEPVSGTESGGADEADGEETVSSAAETPDGEPAEELDDVEPGEEETDAADLLTVTDLDDQVVVVDERPRYHLEECGWLGDRATIPLPAREARDLGFTPCAVCTPDRVLAARSRPSR